MMSFLIQTWFPGSFSIQDVRTHYLGSTRSMEEPEVMILLEKIFSTLSGGNKNKIREAWKKNFGRGRLINEVSIDISMKPFEYTVSLKISDTRAETEQILCDWKF